MGSIDRRLGLLESRAGDAAKEVRQLAYREILRRLTPDEADWLDEPIHEAEMLVACPIHGPGCDCTNEQRRRRGFEEYPELHEEFKRRNNSLKARAAEIMAREPYQETEEDRERSRAKSRERQRASAERNRQHGIGT